MKQEMKEFIIDEYRACWDYYKKNQDERKNMFEWYLKVVGLPATGLFVSFVSIDGEYTLMYFVLSLLVALVGIGFFVAYVKESSNARGFLESINQIRDFYRRKFPKLNKVLIMDRYRDHNRKYESIKFWRSFVFFVLNSAFIASALFFILSEVGNWDWMPFSAASTIFLISIYGHYKIYKKLIGSHQIPEKMRKELGI